MKALYFRKHGSIENLEYGELENPKPQPKEVLLKVSASALNHLDLWVLQGWPGLSLEMPHIGGADIVGTIDSVGAQVKEWSTGSRVAVNPGFITGEDEWTARLEESVSPKYHIFGEGCRGGFSEYVCVPAENLIEVPEEISDEQAAAPLLVSLTSWRMLKVRAGLKKGETVLVVGAGGGLNSFSIQLANYLGAEVIALTSSKEKAKKAEQLGAKHVVNYRSHPEWAREVLRTTKGRGVDVVVDNVGQATFHQSIRAVCRGGRIVTVGNTSGHKVSFDNRLLFTKQISLIGSTMGSFQDFRDVSKLLWEQKLTPIIDKTLPLKDGKNAYKMLEKGEQFGKIVLIPG